MESPLAKVLVVTGPSGVGKGTLIAALRERIFGLELSTSATTRPPRPGEVDGREYHFLTEQEFEEGVAQGNFVEYATYSNHRYGTLRSELDRRLAEGHPVVLEIELQGARQLRESLPEATQIFIAPPDEEALRERLTNRGTDSAAAVKKRLQTADLELAAQGEFGYVVINDRLDDAIDQLEQLVREQLGLIS